MNSENLFLILGGSASFFIFILHLVLTVNPKLYGFFGAEELVKLHREGSKMPRLASIFLALMFFVWGVYALSGAGLLQTLPWLKTILLVIGGIYILRGLMLPSDFVKTLRDIKQAKFIVFSAFSLAVGLLYLFGRAGL